MKKIFFATLIFLLCAQVISAKENKRTFISLSTGYSWFHKYSGLSENGMNIAFNFEPALNEFINIDTSLSVHFYLSEMEDDKLAVPANKLVFISPQISIGPRASLLLFKERFYLFFGAGISFIAGINYSQETRDATADFSPGFYTKAGFDFIVFRSFGMGLNSKYCWSVAHIPHILSLNFNFNFSY